MVSVLKPHSAMIAVLHTLMTLMSASCGLSNTRIHFRKLPVVRLSSTLSSVMPPLHNADQETHYDGIIDLNVSDNESVMVSFSDYYIDNFIIECNPDDDSGLSSVSLQSAQYVRLTVVNENKTWTKCGGPQTIPVLLVRSSFHLHFHRPPWFSNGELSFRVMIVVLPRSAEPQVLPDNLFNCSVPNFHSFRPLLGCNLLKECEGGEDEQGCAYHSNDCGQNAIDAGTKCYRFVRPRRRLTWFDAVSDCDRHSQKLSTFGTPEEFTQFKALISLAKNVSSFLVGGHLVNRLASVSVKSMYRYAWQWVDKRTAFSIQIRVSEIYPSCSLYKAPGITLSRTYCDYPMWANFMCEFGKPGIDRYNNVAVDATASHANVSWNVSVVQCPSGHVSRDFLSCDSLADCGVTESVTSCAVEGMTVPMFVCKRGRSTLHYSLVCDHVQHCSDNSDEDFCQFPECPPSYLACRNGQCIRTQQLCDKRSDCYDGSDEGCWSAKLRTHTFELNHQPPGALYISSNGKYRVTRMNESDDCPQTHFRCLRGFCMPFYLRCNGIDDCPAREDEARCDSYVCPGFYRCRGSNVCMHADDVCDGVPQCPQQDDELLCDLVCPEQCRCQGLAFVCITKFQALSYHDMHYLDASGTGMLPRDLVHNLFLIGLRLSKCRVSSIYLNITLPNLRDLDLSWNSLTRIDLHTFLTLKNLRILVLTGNPLVQMMNINISGSATTKLQLLDLSLTSLEVLNGTALSSSPHLKVLNMSSSRLTTIAQDGFHFTPLLEIVDVKGSPLISFPNDLLRNLERIKAVYTDNYRLCCKAMLPVNFDLRNCHTIQDLLASCEDLLRSNSYRFFLWTFASMSVVGNAVSFGARFYLQKESRSLGSFSVFVTNLSLADFFMGVYLAIIGTADLVFHGQYLWRDDEWKSSTLCKIAGFICLMSSEVSAFIICLITLDRILVLRFPFSRLHFGCRSAMVACAVVWTMGIILAAVPLMPGKSQWEFYSQTSICIPLPFTRNDRFLGYSYSFGVTILLNLILFHLVAVGQAVIIWSMRTNSLASSNDRSSRDAAIARRLTTVVVTDFLCWFPVGLLGLLASGRTIPGELSVAAVIFVIPVNSALNPFLYIFNVFRERRKKAVHEELLKRLENKIRAKWSSDILRKTPESADKPAALQRIQAWLRQLVLTPGDLVSISQEFTF